MVNILVYSYCVNCCSCFSQLLQLVLPYFLYFSVFLLLLEYVKLDNNFCYQVLVEVCMFLIIFIFIIMSMFVCIMFLSHLYKKKKMLCPSTRAPKFSTQMPWLFIIKICFTIKAWRKLIQSVVGVEILRICVTSLILRVLRLEFWVSESGT